MVSKRAWEEYPYHYRAREVKTLADWIQAGESGSIIGLAGVGKSNLLGFLTHRPEVIRSYFRETSLRAALTLVDLNNLPGHDLATFYRVILRSLCEASEQLAALEETLPEAVAKLYRRVEDKSDPFLPQSALREALFLFVKNGVRLVLVLDPFDRFCREANIQVLDNLRGLRDSFKSTLSYLASLRQELAYVCDPAELGELYELLDMHRCWVGPMVEDDACWVICQVQAATGQFFSAEQVEGLLGLTGGYPALLRTASLWLARVWPGPERAAWPDALLAEPGLRNRLQEVWVGLTGEEQAALTALQAALALVPASDKEQKDKKKSLQQIAAKYHPVLADLQLKQICFLTGDTGWRIFSPLFTRFIASAEGSSAGKIWHDQATDRFFRGEKELIGLSEKNRRLLRFFLAQPRISHSVDTLIVAAWSEDDPGGVSNMAVQQAIHHLRTQIEPNPAKPVYLMTEHKSGYRFFPEGAPQR